MVRVRLFRVAFDPQSQSAVVLLRDEAGHRILPITIGPLEAHSIALAVEGQAPLRPLTHDLVKAILDKLNAKVAMVIIDDLRDETFFGQLNLELAEGTVDVDARPSDAIALAVRTGAPIYVMERVLTAAGISEPEEETPDPEGPPGP